MLENSRVRRILIRKPKFLVGDSGDSTREIRLARAVDSMLLLLYRLL